MHHCVLSPPAPPHHHRFPTPLHLTFLIHEPSAVLRLAPNPPLSLVSIYRLQVWGTLPRSLRPLYHRSRHAMHFMHAHLPPVPMVAWLVAAHLSHFPPSHHPPNLYRILLPPWHMQISFHQTLGCWDTMSMGFRRRSIRRTIREIIHVPLHHPLTTPRYSRLLPRHMRYPEHA